MTSRSPRLSRLKRSQRGQAAPRALIGPQSVRDRASACEMLTSGAATAIETDSLSIVQTVETGQGAHGVMIDPTGRHAYVTNIYGNDLAVLDLGERRVVATLPIGTAPNGVSFTPQAPAPARAAESPVGLPSHTENDAHDEEKADGKDQGRRLPSCLRRVGYLAGTPRSRPRYNGLTCRTDVVKGVMRCTRSKCRI